MSDTHDVVISGFDLERIEAELAAVTAQRDKLAAALKSVASGAVGEANCIKIAREALAAVKGGKDE